MGSDAEKVVALQGALKDACELAEEAIGYTPEYFVDKWGMRERLASLRATATLLAAEPLGTCDVPVRFGGTHPTGGHPRLPRCENWRPLPAEKGAGDGR